MDFGLSILLTLKTISCVGAAVDGAANGIGVVFSGGLVAYLDLSDATNISVTNSSSYRWITFESTSASVSALAGDRQLSQIYVNRDYKPRFQANDYTIRTLYIENGAIAAKDATLEQYIPEITGLAFDWLTKTLYWTDASEHLIGAAPTRVVAGFEMTYYLDVLWKTVVSSTVGVPADIVVNPLRCYLFWSEYEVISTVSKISRSDLTGAQRKDIYDSTAGAKITKLTIDFTTDRLYWLSPQESVVGSCDFDGNYIQVYSNEDFQSTIAMTIYQDLLLLGAISSTTFYIYNLSTLSNTSDLNQIASSSFALPAPDGETRLIRSMATLTKTSQPDGSSPCQMKNGYCSQFCFTTSPNTKQCGCGDGFMLNSDNVTCSAVPLSTTSSCLLVSDGFMRKLFQLDTSTRKKTLMLEDITDRNIPALLAYDNRRTEVYATTNSLGTTSIVRMHLSGWNDTIIWTAENPATKIGQLACDSVNQELYFTDETSRAVFKLSTSISGEQAADKIVTSNQKTAATAVDPTNRLLYWSECPRGKGVFATIKRANAANGSDQQTLVTADLAGTCYTSFALDVNDQRLYWTSDTYDLNSTFVQSTIEQAFTDGTQKSTLHWTDNEVYTRLTHLDGSLHVIVRRSPAPEDITSIM